MSKEEKNSPVDAVELVLLKQMKSDDAGIATKAANELALKYLWLIKFTAKKIFKLKGSLAKEAINQAFIKFREKITEFDLKKQFKVSTYMMWWIREGVRECLLQQRVISIPQHVADFRHRLKKTKKQLEEEFGRKVGIREVLELLEISFSDYSRKDTRVVKSLNSHPNLGEALELGETISDEQYSSEKTEEILRKERLREIVGRLLETLSLYEAKIIKKRFRIDEIDSEDEKRTFEEVGEMLSSTRQNIQQWEEKIFAKIRHSNRRELLEKLKDFYEEI